MDEELELGSDDQMSDEQAATMRANFEAELERTDMEEVTVANAPESDDERE